MSNASFQFVPLAVLGDVARVSLFNGHRVPSDDLRRLWGRMRGLGDVVMAPAVHDVQNLRRELAPTYAAHSRALSNNVCLWRTSSSANLPDSIVETRCDFTFANRVRY